MNEVLESYIASKIPAEARKAHELTEQVMRAAWMAGERYGRALPTPIEKGARLSDGSDSSDMSDGHTPASLIAFEAHIRELWEAGELPYLLHLCGGNERELIAIFREVKSGDWIFSGHRSHYHYLLAGGSPAKLEGMIRRGDSMFVFDRELNFYTSSVLAGTCAIAAGVAWQLKAEGSPNRVWCFLGDGAEDEGHFYEAVTFVEGSQLPCTFVIEDNNRSVETSVTDRGRARIAWPPCVRRYTYTPAFPHAGSGCKFTIQFKDRECESGKVGKCEDVKVTTEGTNK